jgi:hypothetical protein
MSDGNWFTNTMFIFGKQIRIMRYGVCTKEMTLLNMYRYEIWDMGYGIWDMGYGIWDMGYGICLYEASEWLNELYV